MAAFHEEHGVVSRIQDEDVALEHVYDFHLLLLLVLLKKLVSEEAPLIFLHDEVENCCAEQCDKNDRNR